MSEDLMLKCLIAFVLGYLVARMMRGNGLMVGGQTTVTPVDPDIDRLETIFSKNHDIINDIFSTDVRAEGGSGGDDARIIRNIIFKEQDLIMGIQNAINQYTQAMKTFDDGEGKSYN